MVESKSILVITVEHDIRVKVRRKFEENGFFVLSVTSYAEALALIEKVSVPSMVLLSRNVVGISAEEFIEMLRKHEGFEKVPVTQICLEDEPRIEGTCSLTKLSNLHSIVNWFNTGMTPSDWVMP